MAETTQPLTSVSIGTRAQNQQLLQVLDAQRGRLW